MPKLEAGGDLAEVFGFLKPKDFTMIGGFPQPKNIKHRHVSSNLPTISGSLLPQALNFTCSCSRWPWRCHSMTSPPRGSATWPGPSPRRHCPWPWDASVGCDTKRTQGVSWKRCLARWPLQPSESSSPSRKASRLCGR